MQERIKGLDDCRGWNPNEDRKAALDMLDFIPAKKLPYWVDTVFFGGGWFPLYHYIRGRGYSDGYFVFVSPFYITLDPISALDWESCMPLGDFWGPNDHNAKFPIKVTWDKAVEYCNKRSEEEGLEQCYRFEGSRVFCDWDANGYRLPTEAELNYATPGYRRRLYAKPDPFPAKVDMNAYHIPFLDHSSHDLRNYLSKTMVWNRYFEHYLRSSLGIDPTGSESGSSSHVCRRYARSHLPHEGDYKPLRERLKPKDRCQFYVVRTWIFANDPRHGNLTSGLPQWDRGD
jgi:hypothetical protein